MKRFVIICILLVLGFVIQYDLRHGALNHTNFYNHTECETEEIVQFVQTKIQAGDTIHSIFNNVSSEVEFPFIERLANFYELNPHLQKQPLVTGDFVKVPIKVKTNCKN